MASIYPPQLAFASTPMHPSSSRPSLSHSASTPNLAQSPQRQSSFPSFSASNYSPAAQPPLTTNDLRTPQPANSNSNNNANNYINWGGLQFSNQQNGGQIGSPAPQRQNSTGFGEKKYIPSHLAQMHKVWPSFYCLSFFTIYLTDTELPYTRPVITSSIREAVHRKRLAVSDNTHTLSHSYRL